MASALKKKWVLVYWTESKQISVKSSEFVHDKTMLEDKTKVGMVTFGNCNAKPPPNGWDSYRAKVLAWSEKKSVILKKEQELLADLNPESTDEDVEMMDEPRDSEAKVNQVTSNTMKKKAEKSAMAELLLDDQDDEFSRMAKPELIAVVRQQRKELEKLNGTFQSVLEENISSAVEKAVTRVMKRTSAFSGTAPITSSRKKITSPSPLSAPSWTTSPSTSPSWPASPSRTASPSPSSAHNDQDTQSSHSSEACGDAVDKVRTYLSEAQLGLLQLHQKSWSKSVLALMGMLFTQDEMAESIVSGRRMKQAYKGKSLLDQEKVHAIIEYAVTRWPEVSSSEVRQKMGQKVKDIRLARDKAQKEALEAQTE